MVSPPTLVPVYVKVTWPLALVVPDPEALVAPATEKLTGWPAIDPPGLVMVAVTVCVVPTVLVAVGGDRVKVGCATTIPPTIRTVSYTHLRAHETGRNLVCR